MGMTLISINQRQTSTKCYVCARILRCVAECTCGCCVFVLCHHSANLMTRFRSANLAEMPRHASVFHIFYRSTQPMRKILSHHSQTRTPRPLCQRRRERRRRRRVTIKHLNAHNIWTHNSPGWHTYTFPHRWIVQIYGFAQPGYVDALRNFAASHADTLLILRARANAFG